MLPNFPSSHPASGKSTTSSRDWGWSRILRISCFLKPWLMRLLKECLTMWNSLSSQRQGMAACWAEEPASCSGRQQPPRNRPFSQFTMVTPVLSMDLLLLSVQQSDSGFYMISLMVSKLETIPLPQVKSAIISFFVCLCFHSQS